MLFNSYFFILVYLPATLAVFFALGARGQTKLAIGWLVAASLFFYGWWDAKYLTVIVTSILLNYVVGGILGDLHRQAKARKAILIAGITANLIVLGYFKYFNFFVTSANGVMGSAYPTSNIVLPLGISFFTFTQIAFLVDAHRGEVREYDLTRYSLFVTFYPHLIAGPVLHHKEMMPQFGNPSIFRFDALNFASGLTYFVFGLFKKVVIADNIAVYVPPAFSAAGSGAALTSLDAWGGALAYTFQLYFDFSGYSDMAIGLALMMGVRLPLNFNSPYKAVNIIDFWRRWHMTLSRFLRDYLYFALGGNRKGEARRYINLFLTMLLGGIWHGAGWTFVAWGALHGFYLMVNHAWHACCHRLGRDPNQSRGWGLAIGRLLTFIAVVVGWVCFRATNLEGAWRILTSMASFTDLRLSPHYAKVLEDSAPGRLLQLAGISMPAELLLVSCVTAVGAIAFMAPNTQEIMGRYYWAPRGSLESVPDRAPGLWSPSRRWIGITSAAVACSLLQLTSVSEFLYFQF